MLGLATRAGQLVFGSDAVERGARRGQIRLLILAADAGPNTTGRFGQVSRVTHIPLIQVSDRESFGHWTGKDERVVAGVKDQGFAQRILDLAGQTASDQPADAGIESANNDVGGRTR
jgi:ribosomal protein L7Ae-like RNA K-turn-binding protein